MILQCLVIASALARSSAGSQGAGAPPREPDAPTATVRIEPKAGPGLLVIRSSLLEGESFTFVTCEALIEAETTSSLFPIQLGAEGWKNDGGRWAYSWEFEDKLRLDFSAAPEADSVRFEYKLTNGSHETSREVAIFPCLPSLGAPSFYPGTAAEAQDDPSGRKARVEHHDYSELYGRLSLFADGKQFSFKDSKLASAEKHLAFMRTGAEPLRWSWWVIGEQRFDVPLLVESSRDGRYSVGLAFDRGVQASSNVGDGRACVHVVPRFREIPAGQSVSTVGRFYWMQASPEALLARYRRDFPKPARD